MEAVFLGEMDFGFEEIAEAGSGEKVGFGTVGDDAAIFHHEDAVDLGRDVGDVMGDEEDSSSMLGEATQGLRSSAGRRDRGR